MSKELIFWVTFGNDPEHPLKLRAIDLEDFCFRLRDMSMKYGEFTLIVRDHRK